MKRIFTLLLAMLLVMGMLPAMAFPAHATNEEPAARGTCNTTITVVLDASLYPESDHSYANDADDWQTVIYPGAISLTLTFSNDTYTEFSYDTIRVYNKNDDLIASYSGRQAAGISLTVPGDTAKIRLTTDYSSTYYGYSFSEITAITVEHTGKPQGSKAPTCTEPGFAEVFECEICGEYYGTQVIPALGHDYDSAVTDATCEKEGFTTYTCSRCGDVTKDDFVEAYGHSYENGVTYIAPTATSDGTMSTNCAYCGRVSSVVLANDVSAPADSPFHDWEWEVLQITNSLRCNAGLQPLTGFALLQDVAAIRAEEIDYYFEHTRPDGRSCFTAFDDIGLTYYGAGENIAAGYPNPAYVMYGWMNSPGHRANILTDWFAHLGAGYDYISTHDWTQMFLSGGEYTDYALVLPENTTYEAGTLIDEMGIYLLLNSSFYGQCYLPMQSMYCEGYDPNRAGRQTVTCSVLGFTGSFEITIAGDDPCADGHSFGAWTETKAPSCTENGTERRDCANCDHYETRDIAAKGHDYKSVVTVPTCTEQGYTTYTCACGDSYVDDYVDAAGHSFGDWTVTKAPTSTEKGIERRDCANCDHYETREIAKIDNNACVLTVTTERSRAGDEVSVDIVISDNPGVMVMVLDFEYDKTRLEYVGHEDGIFKSWEVNESAVWIGDNDVTDNGTILTLTFKVLEDAPEGTGFVRIAYTPGNIANYDEEEINPALVDGGVEVYTSVPGDATGDGKVNALDLVRLKKFLSGADVEFDASGADATGDGKVNALDLVRLKKFLSGADVTLG